MKCFEVLTAFKLLVFAALLQPLSLRILTCLVLLKDDALKKAGDAVSFVFRTKTFGQETVQQESRQ